MNRSTHRLSLRSDGLTSATARDPRHNERMTTLLRTAGLQYARVLARMRDWRRTRAECAGRSGKVPFAQNDGIKESIGNGGDGWLQCCLARGPGAFAPVGCADDVDHRHIIEAQGKVAFPIVRGDAIRGVVTSSAKAELVPCGQDPQSRIGK